jgi:hypothetical protein
MDAPTPGVTAQAGDRAVEAAAEVEGPLGPATCVGT